MNPGTGRSVQRERGGRRRGIRRLRSLRFVHPALAAALPHPLPPPPDPADSFIGFHTLEFQKGQDIHARILEFSRRRRENILVQARRENIVVIAFSGTLSRFTIGHPYCITDTVYEGLFKITMLQGGFFWDQNEASSRRHGGFSIQVRNAGEEIAGTVSGPMIAGRQTTLILGTCDPSQTQYLVWLSDESSTNQSHTDT